MNTDNAKRSVVPCCKCGTTDWTIQRGDNGRAWCGACAMDEIESLQRDRDERAKQKGEMFAEIDLLRRTVAEVQAARIDAAAESAEWKQRAVGGMCRMLSKGDACECSLCIRDKMIAELTKERDTLQHLLGVAQAAILTSRQEGR